MSVLARPLKWPPVFPLEKGLVLWLPFDDRSGARAMDRSGKANHGALYGPTWAAGLRGSALSFDGVDDYVEVPHRANLTLIEKVSVAVWLYKSSFTGTFETIVDKRESYQLFIDDEKKPSFAYYDGAAWRVLASLVDYALNTWVHIAVTQKISNGDTLVTLYRNGALDRQATLTNRPTTSTEDLHIGHTPWVGTRPYSGLINEVCIYNRVLNAAEVKRLYESEIPLVRH